VFVKPGTAGRVTGAEAGQAPTFSTGGKGAAAGGEVEQLFRRFSGGDDQMDAGEFAAAVSAILDKGV